MILVVYESFHMEEEFSKLRRANSFILETGAEVKNELNFYISVISPSSS